MLQHRGSVKATLHWAGSLRGSLLRWNLLILRVDRPIAHPLAFQAWRRISQEEKANFGEPDDMTEQSAVFTFGFQAMSLEKQTRELEAEPPDRQMRRSLNSTLASLTFSFTRALPEAQLARAACEKALSVSHPRISHEIATSEAQLKAGRLFEEAAGAASGVPRR